MMGDMSLHGWDGKSVKENYWNEADEMKQEVDSKDWVVHIDMSDL